MKGEDEEKFALKFIYKQKWPTKYSAPKDLLHENKKMDEKVAKFQFYQICHTITYLHSKNVCHRDLKLANILLMEPDPQSLLKVSDFGVSKVWSATNHLVSMVGTPAFMAPEVLALGPRHSSNNG